MFRPQRLTNILFNKDERNQFIKNFQPFQDGGREKSYYEKSAVRRHYGSGLLGTSF